jgi:hypothetical protein
MKKLKYLPGIFILCLLFTLSSSFAQSINDFVLDLREKIDTYIIANPQDNIFLHIDRSVYFPGESVLFHASVTEATNLQLSRRSNRCIIALKDCNGNEIISSSYNLVNGYAAGSFMLPENSMHGAFYLVGELSSSDENLVHKQFKKEIFITDPDNLLMIDYSLNQEAYKPGDEMDLAINAYGRKSKTIAGVNYSYQVRNGEELLFKGDGKSSKDGLFSIQYKLPEGDLKDIYIDVNAARRKVKQHFSIEIPLVEAKKSNRNDDGIEIIFGEITDKKLITSLDYSASGLEGDKKVIISIFRKGLLYFYAPVALEKAKNLPLPVINIPSGVLNIVLFSEDGAFLNEKMVYFERQDKPAIFIQLDKESYGKRQQVSGKVLFSRQLSDIPKGAHLSVSVVLKDMISDKELLLDDMLLIDSDLTMDNGKCIAVAREDADSEKRISELLKNSQRNSYSWDQLLKGADAAKNESSENFNMEDKLPNWFDASRMNEFAMGMKDTRLPSDNEQNYKIQLRSGVALLDVIKHMKPYTLEDNSKIVFTRSKNSILSQDGALIVIDNQLMGDDATALNTVVPSQVESIKISTSPGDILQYSGTNSVGVIIISTKNSDDESVISDETPRDQHIRDSFGSYLRGYPDYSIERDINSVTADYRTLLYWEPVQLFPNTEETVFEFYTSDLKGEYVITIQGMVGVFPVAVRKKFEVK